MKIMREIIAASECAGDVMPRLEMMNEVECPRCRTKLTETYMYRHQKIEIENCIKWFFKQAQENEILLRENKKLADRVAELEEENEKYFNESVQRNYDSFHKYGR